MQEKYSLNEQTLQFIIDFEKNIETGKTFTSNELVNLFENSTYNREQFNTYKKTKVNSIWYAIKRSGKWLKVERAFYQKI